MAPTGRGEADIGRVDVGGEEEADGPHREAVREGLAGREADAGLRAEPTRPATSESETDSRRDWPEVSALGVSAGSAARR
jgi:hypothetical protein